MATSPLSTEEVVIKTLLRIEMPQHSELHAWCDGKLTPSSGTHKSNCDLVNELLVTSEKAASFLLRHLTLSIVLFLLPPVSFWNSGGAHGILEGKEYIMLFLMASNATELLLTVKVGHPGMFRFEAGVCQVGRGSGGTEREGDF